MARITGLDPAVVAAAWPRVLAKLADQPVEDLRLDLEDGYGNRSDDDEDWDASRVGEVLAEIGGDAAPLVRGMRVKSLEAPTRRRGVRSLDLVLGALGGHAAARLRRHAAEGDLGGPGRARWCCSASGSSRRTAWPSGSLRFEVQVETPQAVLGADGTATVARVVHAADGRCTGLHYGTYDYSASLGVAAAHQAMDHPVADHAKAVMQVAAAQTGVRVSDGSTNVLPVGDREHVEAAWALHARLVRRSLERGIYQGWDLHPAQLPTRYLATFAFYRAGLAAAVARLRDYLDRRAGGVLDEPATAFALAGFLLRGARLRRRGRRRGRGRRRPDGRRRCAGWPGARGRALLDALPAASCAAAARGLRRHRAGSTWSRPPRPTAAPTRCWRRPTWRSPRSTRATSTRPSPGTRGSASVGGRDVAARAVRRRRRDPGRAGRGQPGLRGTVRPRLPGLPPAAAAARSCSRARSRLQRPGPRARGGPRGARQRSTGCGCNGCWRESVMVTTHVLDAAPGGRRQASGSGWSAPTARRRRGAHRRRRPGRDLGGTLAR